MLGLQRAAPSMAYSLVKVAPSSRRRVGDSWRVRVEAIGELVGVPEERVGQAVMSTLEPRDHVVEAPLNFVVRQRQDALQDCRRPGLLLVEALVPRDEQAGHHTRPVGGNVDRAATGQARSLHASLQDAHGRPAVLQGREEGERRLGALVEIGAADAAGHQRRRRCRGPT